MARKNEQPKLVVPYDPEAQYTMAVQYGDNLKELVPICVPDCYECLALVYLFQRKEGVEEDGTYPYVAVGVHLPPQKPGKTTTTTRNDLLEICTTNEKQYKLLWLFCAGGVVRTPGQAFMFNHMIDKVLSPLRFKTERLGAKLLHIKPTPQTERITLEVRFHSNKVVLERQQLGVTHHRYSFSC